MPSPEPLQPISFLYNPYSFPAVFLYVFWRLVNAKIEALYVRTCPSFSFCHGESVMYVSVLEKLQHKYDWLQFLKKEENGNMPRDQ